MVMPSALVAIWVAIITRAQAMISDRLALSPLGLTHLAKMSQGANPHFTVVHHLPAPPTGARRRRLGHIPHMAGAFSCELR